ncbi:secreted protein [Lichtheimia corymbifera JMRC:FSU:9682]|uniref:Secreted protein n=1 Tax=Lichtheimia corymbifera JMRC:FSU:9682 TaxID=1263082 RepID=A0A068RUC8_9FUNG|nr:secreted protein [Lichtheimia corymbifera JMRC:FSU:9682]
MKWIKAGITLVSVHFLTTAVFAYETLDASKFTLKGYPNRYDDLIAKLDDALPNISVAKVIADTNHPMKSYSGPSNFVKDFTWDKKSGYDDQGTTKWYPQGITSSSDAYDKGTYGENDIILASWYDHDKVGGVNKGVRISFIDAKNNKYRNVLLVVPDTDSSGTVSFHAVKVHAGGIMWYGDKLYVVDTNNGIRIFDLNHIYEVSIGDKIGHVGSGKYQAYNYKYVIPQWGHYLADSAEAKDFNYSFISLDRTTTPDSLIMGQYDINGTKNRIVRFDIDYQTRLLKHSSGTTATATEYYNMGLKSMQGATSVNGRYYFSCSRGASKAGDLYTWVVGEEPKVHTGALSIGCEDLAYRKQNDELWNLGEHPNKRPVYAIKAGNY